MFERLDLDKAIRELSNVKQEIAHLKSQVKKEGEERLAVFEKYGAIDVLKLCELWETCRENVLCNSLGDKDDVIELDQEGLVRFVLSVCEIVGFCRDEDDRDG